MPAVKLSTTRSLVCPFAGLVSKSAVTVDHYVCMCNIVQSLSVSRHTPHDASSLVPARANLHTWVGARSQSPGLTSDSQSCR